MTGVSEVSTELAPDLQTTNPSFFYPLPSQTSRLIYTNPRLYVIQIILLSFIHYRVWRSGRVVWGKLFRGRVVWHSPEGMGKRELQSKAFTLPGASSSYLSQKKIVKESSRWFSQLLYVLLSRYNCSLVTRKMVCFIIKFKKQSC